MRGIALAILVLSFVLVNERAGYERLNVWFLIVSLVAALGCIIAGA